MAGGLFAISRDYFWDIGSYDEQMNGWGGEVNRIFFLIIYHLDLKDKFNNMLLQFKIHSPLLILFLES